MPRQTGIVVENDFRKGLVSEATAINYPPNAVVSTDNCEFDLDGSVRRRLGLDFETGYETKTINRSNVAVTTYLWKNVSGNGDVSLYVVQIGAVLYFYRTDAENFSLGAVTDTVTLSPVSGYTTAAAALDECQYTDGNGVLIVTHPHCDPHKITYDIDTDNATATTITVYIRDFEGDINDPYDITTRPTATEAGLDARHKYNLYNQGWTSTGLTAWDTAQTTMPSNADVMWAFRDSSNNLDFSTTSLGRIVAGNTPAPKGFYTLRLADQDRNAIYTGATNTTTGTSRPSTCCFYAGRVFYSGINYKGFTNNIYFTQIIERDEQYGAAHQKNDPTSEDLFDLLPTDGGVIHIQEAGIIYKMMPTVGGLAVFASNGVWFITGSQGLGFTATDYTVQKISSVASISHCSFVEVNGVPTWWNAEAIYTLVPQNGALPAVQPISVDSIDTFYREIPLQSKRFARGIYHTMDKHIRWIYRSEETSQLTEQYEFNKVLNYNVVTQAFFPWTIADSDVKVNAILVSELTSGTVSSLDVGDASLVDSVVDSLGNQVIVFQIAGLETSPFDKYLVSYPEAGSYEFTFADKINADYVDWFSYDNEGINFDSHFTTGYRIRGQAANRFQNNWVRVYSRTDEPISYNFQGLWNYALSGDTGKWSSVQLVEHDNLDYQFQSKRLKVRGSGLALQFKVSSVIGEPFNIVGWATVQSNNQLP